VLVEMLPIHEREKGSNFTGERPSIDSNGIWQ
jgi:hypothetical protein